MPTSSTTTAEFTIHEVALGYYQGCYAVCRNDQPLLYTSYLSVALQLLIGLYA